MAGAVLRRYAVKMLGSRALQRPQLSYAAAADNIPGGRTVRPTSSSRSSTCYGAQNSSTKRACAKSTEEPLAQKNKEYLASTQQKEIESKTEELFHLIAKMDRELPSHCGRDNIQLLMHLSKLVQPKPDDPQWRFYRRALRINIYAIYGFVLSLGYMAVSDDISQAYDVLVKQGRIPPYLRVVHGAPLKLPPPPLKILAMDEEAESAGSGLGFLDLAERRGGERTDGWSSDRSIDPHEII